MEFKAEYSGKWIAVKNEKMIAAEKTFNKLKKKVLDQSDFQELRFTLLPAGRI